MNVFLMVCHSKALTERQGNIMPSNELIYFLVELLVCAIVCGAGFLLCLDWLRLAVRIDASEPIEIDLTERTYGNDRIEK